MDAMRHTNVSIIHEGLMAWPRILSTRAKLNLLDAHQSAEEVGCRILNLLFDYELENLNKRGKVRPPIDLGNTQGLGVQVTTEATAEKMRKTIKTIRRRRYHHKFPRLKFLFLVEEYRGSREDIEHEGIEFDPGEDILDLLALVDRAQHVEVSTQRALIKLLKDERIIIGEDSESTFSLVRSQIVIDERSVPAKREIHFFNKGPAPVGKVYIGSYLMARDGGTRTILYDEIRTDVKPGPNPICWGDLIKSDFRRYSPHETEDRDYYHNTLTERLQDFLAKTSWPVLLLATVRAAGDDDKQRSHIEFWIATEPVRDIEDAMWTHVHQPIGVQQQALEFVDKAYRNRWAQFRELTS